MVHPLCSRMLEEKEQNLKLAYDARENRCRYHPTSASNKHVNILSQGMCPVAYANLYPTLFALHLSKDLSKSEINPDGHIVQCPLGADGVSFRVYANAKRFDLLGYAKNIIRRVANLLIPVEMYDKDTLIEARDEGKGCPFGIKKGDKFYFNLDHDNELCPAAFNSVYPFLDVKQSNFVLGCPDYRTQVAFSLEENPLKNTQGVIAGCDSYSTKVKIHSLVGNIQCPIQTDRWYSVDELIEATGIRCFTSFHVAFPYFYALHNGGQLGFLTLKREAAGVCCPNTSLMIKYLISKDDGEKYKFTCTQTHAECPRKIGLNEEIFPDNFANALPFYKSLDALYIMLRKMESRDTCLGGLSETTISSINGNKGVIWTIMRNETSSGAPS